MNKSGKAKNPKKQTAGRPKVQSEGEASFVAKRKNHATPMPGQGCLSRMLGMLTGRQEYLNQAPKTLTTLKNKPDREAIERT
ncbi:MAG: hypothetical protein [Microvirus sp.]|nr:MAG: hypothetical protein [Microvirus sp.]